MIVLLWVGMVNNTRNIYQSNAYMHVVPLPQSPDAPFILYPHIKRPPLTSVSIPALSPTPPHALHSTLVHCHTLVGHQVATKYATNLNNGHVWKSNWYITAWHPQIVFHHIIEFMNIPILSDNIWSVVLLTKKIHNLGFSRYYLN